MKIAQSHKKAQLAPALRQPLRVVKIIFYADADPELLAVSSYFRRTNYLSPFVLIRSASEIILTAFAEEIATCQYQNQAQQVKAGC